MGDWQSFFRSSGSESLLHPDAPSSTSGPGHFHDPHAAWESAQVPHPRSPAGRTFDWLALPEIDLDDRVRAVLEAIHVAEMHAPQAVLEATGEELGEILKGIIPGLLLCLCVVAGTTAVGAVGGAALGALAGGIGALPGAALGAGLGLQAGVALLEALGLAFLAVMIGTSLIEATGMAAGAVNEAWHAIDDPSARWFHIEHAGKTLAAALAVAFRGILEGVVGYLLARGAASAASRVPTLVAKLRASRLGEGFAIWVERNWASLLKNEKLRPRNAQGRASTAAGVDSTPKTGGTKSQPSADSAAQKSARPSAEAAATRSARTVPTGRAGGVPTGKRTPVRPQDDLATQRSHRRENESADLLAKEGYHVEQNPAVEGGKKPDYSIEGRTFDCKAPETSRARNAASEIEKSVRDGQADRTVLNLEDSALSPADMKAQLNQYPIEGLKEVIAIKDGKVIPLWP
jgi:hypothetical protein